MELHTDGRPIMRFSLYDAWRKSKHDAIQRYFPKEQKSISTPWMSFGSRVAEALTERPIPEWVAHLAMPEYDEQEYRIIEDMEGYLVRGTLDRYSTSLHRILDDKCSNTMWKKSKAQKHMQLDFYSVLVKERFGEIDNISYIHCIPIDMDDNGFIRFTGETPILLPHETTHYMRTQLREKILETAEEIRNDFIAWSRATCE